MVCRTRPRPETGPAGPRTALPLATQRRSLETVHGERTQATRHALVRPRRRRRLLRPRPRQPRPAAADRRALPRRARLPGRARLRPRCCPAPPSRSSSATSSTRGRRSGSPRAPGAPTSARCPTASTPSRSSPTSSWSCCRRSSPPQAAGAADPARVAWQAGLLACVGSGLIELAGAFVAERVRKATPRAALLSTLAGIALSFISLGFLFRTFARPVVGLTTLGDRDAHLLRPRAVQGAACPAGSSPSRSARCSPG